MNKSDEQLDEILDELSFNGINDVSYCPGGHRLEKYGREEAKKAIKQLLQSQTLEAENKVIEKANSPCECGRDHFGTPVRSVQGGVTTYCQFSKVQMSELNNQKKGIE